MKNESVSEIKHRLQLIENKEDEKIINWKKDPRKGVQQALSQWNRRIEKKEKELSLFREMTVFENQAYQEGHRLIAGIDEVGRGPLAGPVVAAAVILPKNCQLLGVNDSKKLTAEKRNELYDKIQKQAISIGVSMVSHTKIDEINIYQASKLAMGQAVENLSFMPDYLLIDAMKLDIDIPQQNLIKGDSRSVSIAAASIVAKVVRDQLMEDYATIYAGYGFEKNAGYGTKEHLLGIEKQGVCPIHRKTFGPVKEYV